MRKAVVTLATGKEYEDIAKVSHPSINVYADRMGADFITISDQQHSYPRFDKLRLRNFLELYDRILYVDTDVIIRKDCPDMFYLFPEDKLVAFNEGDLRAGWQTSLTKYATRLGLKPDSWKGVFVNTGVMLLNKSHADVFAAPPKYLADVDAEQMWLNVRIQQTETQVHCLPKAFNQLKAYGTFRYQYVSYIIHYADMPISKRIKCMKYDLDVWESLSVKG